MSDLKITRHGYLKNRKTEQCPECKRDSAFRNLKKGGRFQTKYDEITTISCYQCVNCGCQFHYTHKKKI